jgi:hypothetical protein
MVKQQLFSIFAMALLAPACLCAQPAATPPQSAANKFMHGSDFHELVARFEDPFRAQWQKPGGFLNHSRRRVRSNFCEQRPSENRRIQNNRQQTVESAQHLSSKGLLAASSQAVERNGSSENECCFGRLTALIII